MLLAIDIGNTNIAFGLFNGAALSFHWRFAAGHWKMRDELGMLLLGFFRRAGISEKDIRAVAMASVVPPLTGEFAEACRVYVGREPYIVDGASRTGIRIRYEDPGQVGADRIADAVAGYKLYGVPVCIIDFGTATTFDAVSAEGDYIGGAIAPGIGISAEALFQCAAKLPKVNFTRPPSAIGKNTVHALQSGLLFGYVGLVEGIVSRFRSELGPSTKVVATGGWAETVANETSIISHIAPWLTLDGLRIIHEMNVRDSGSDLRR